MWYFEEGDVVLWKNVVFYFEDIIVYGIFEFEMLTDIIEFGIFIVLKLCWFFLQIKRIFEVIIVDKLQNFGEEIKPLGETMTVATIELYATLKMVMWYFEEGDVVLWRGWCGTLKMVWYFEEGCVVLWRG